MKRFFSGLSFLFLLHFGLFAQSKAADYHPSVMVPYRVMDKWGYADTLGKMLIKPQFDSIGIFYHNKTLNTALSWFEEKGKFGVMNHKGVVVLPPNFTHIDLSEFRGFEKAEDPFVACNGKGCGALDFKGKMVLPFEYEAITTIPSISMLLVKKNGFWGLVSYKNALVIPIIYEKVVHMWHGNYFEAYKENKIYTIDINGNITKETENEDYEGDDAAPVVEDEGSDLPYSEDNYSAFAQKLGYDAIKNGPGAEFLITMKHGIFGLIDRNGKVIFTPQYNSILLWTDSKYIKGGVLFFVKKGKYVGAVNKSNEVIWPFEYSFIKSEDDIRYITYKNNKKGCFMPGTFYPPIPAVYDDLCFAYSLPVNSGWSFTLLKVKKNGKWGFVGENGIEFFKG